MSRLVTWMFCGAKVSLSWSSALEKEGVAASHWSWACLIRARALTAFPAMAWERAMARDLFGWLMFLRVGMEGKYVLESSKVLRCRL